jgi:hypothetical protein
MATLITLGSKGINLDTVTNWQDNAKKDKLYVWFVGVTEELVFCGDERARILAALASNSMEY